MTRAGRSAAGRSVPGEAGPVAGVVLAAGMSRRMGRPKQLLDLHGKPVVSHVVERALASGLDSVLVVLGHEAERVRDALTLYAVETVTNPAFADGQSTSLVAGVRAVPPETDAIVVLLGDQPGIEPDVIDQAIAARREQSASIVMAAYGEQRSHPVLFGRERFSELMELQGDAGGRDIIRRHQADVHLVASGLPAPPVDVDTETAYIALLRSWHNIP